MTLPMSMKIMTLELATMDISASNVNTYFANIVWKLVAKNSKVNVNETHNIAEIWIMKREIVDKIITNL